MCEHRPKSAHGLRCEAGKLEQIAFQKSGDEVASPVVACAVVGSEQAFGEAAFVEVGFEGETDRWRVVGGLILRLLDLFPRKGSKFFVCYAPGKRFGALFDEITGCRTEYQVLSILVGLMGMNLLINKSTNDGKEFWKALNFIDADEMIRKGG